MDLCASRQDHFMLLIVFRREYYKSIINLKTQFLSIKCYLRDLVKRYQYFCAPMRVSYLEVLLKKKINIV